MKRVAVVGAAAAIMAVPFTSTANAGVIACSLRLLGGDAPGWWNCNTDTLSNCLHWWDLLEGDPVGDTITFADCSI